MSGAEPAARAARRAQWPSLSDRLTLGEGLRVSPFCLGRVRDPAVVTAAFDRGINFFFLSADMHWPVYEAARRGLADLLRARPSARADVVVGVVSYVAQRDFSVVPFLEVLQAVPGLERIDLTIVGGVTGVEPARVASFAAHRRDGHVPGVRATGATFHDRAAAVDMMRSGGLDIGFVRYNTDHRGAERDLFPLLSPARHGLVFNFKSALGHVPHHRFEPLGFAPDAWRPTVPDHYRFVLGRPELDGILCSPLEVTELDALERALEKGPLSDAQVTYMKGATDLHRGRPPERATAAAP